MNIADDFAIRLITELFEARTGQKLNGDRQWRIENVLSSVLRDNGLLTINQLGARLLQPGQDQLTQSVVEALLNNETYFFRDRMVFDLLANKVLPDLAELRQNRKTLSIWSAGCSTGQEALTLAMLFCDNWARWAGWNIRILGTDISSKAITAARDACYSAFQVQRGLGIKEMLGHFEETPAGWQASSLLKRLVRFERHNIMDAPPAGGPFDIVLCRNVLLYFDDAARSRAFSRISYSLAHDGVLLLGGGETTVGHSDELAPSTKYPGMFSRNRQPVGVGGLRTAGSAA